MTDLNKKDSKAKNKFKIIILLLLLTFLYLLFKYFSNQIKILEAKKFINPESLIEIASDIYKDNKKAKDQNDLEKNSNYSILEYKTKIEDLNNKYEILKSRVETIKNQDKLSLIIINFIDLDYQIKNNLNYQDNLQKLEILASNDRVLTNKINKLKFALKNQPQSQKEIARSFQLLIPEIMAKKAELSGGQGLFNKIKNNITRSIIIRRVDGVVTKPSENVDFIISETEKMIDKENYERAAELLLKLEDDYRPILIKIISELKNNNQINKAISDIFSYLKELSHN